MTKLLPMMNGNLDPVRASEARAVDAPLPLHHHAFKTHEGTGFHQPRTFLGGEGFGEFHGVRLERVLKLPKNRMPLFQRPIEQRVAVHMQAIKDHVAEMARKLPVPGSKAGLQRLEVRLALVVDDVTSPSRSSEVGNPRSASETGPKRFVKECPLRDTTRTEPSRICQDPEAVPLRLVGPVWGREHGVDLAKQHRRRLAWMRVATTLVHAKAGEGAGNGLCEHGTSLIAAKKNTSNDTPARPCSAGLPSSKDVSRPIGRESDDRLCRSFCSGSWRASSSNTDIVLDCPLTRAAIFEQACATDARRTASVED